ncbi:MAG: hypothetical protein GY751_15720 [Bacteroidetes bacterium]|nr:hypothetical protein [Bacteroidota bacterium]
MIIGITSCGNVINEGLSYGEDTTRILPSTAKEILSFEVSGQTGSALINTESSTVFVTVGYGSGLTDLAPVITVPEKAGISPASGEEIDFSSGPVLYTTTAEDGTKQKWSVTVTEALNSSNDITGFYFYASNNIQLSSYVSANINQYDNTISIEVPYGTDVSSLTASFTTSGSSVSINTEEQISDITENDFSSSRTYIVMAADYSTKEYTVSVTEGSNQWKGTQRFGFSSSNRPMGAAADCTGNIYVSGYGNGSFDGSTNPNDYGSFLVKYNPSGEQVWARLQNTTANERSCDVLVDHQGNIYTAVNSSGTFDGFTNQGGSDIFLFKYNSLGEIVWTRHLASSEADWALGLAADRTGNIYVTGHTYGNLDGEASMYRGIFLAKYSSSGESLWVKQLRTAPYASASAVTVSAAGTVIITGETSNTFDGHSTSGYSDCLLVAYNSEGEKQWSTLLGSTGYEGGQDISTDANGTIYVTGDTDGDLDGTGDEAREGYTGNELFLAKFNPSGGNIWIRRFASTGPVEGHGISIDSLNNIYAAGYCNDDTGSDLNISSQDILLQKYNSNGDMLWSRMMVTSSSDIAYGVTANRKGVIYITGFAGSGLDDTTPETLQNSFLMQYNSEGEKQ